MHLFGLQGVTASSEIKRVQTNGFLKCNSGAARNGAIRLQQVFLASDLLSLSIQLVPVPDAGYGFFWTYWNV